MKKIDLGQSVSILANLGVIAGIVFLGVELRQNTASITGTTYQAMSDVAVNQMQGVYQDSVLAVALRRTFRGYPLEDFTEEENAKLTYFYFALIQGMENTFNQFEAGLVDDRVFQSYGWNQGTFDTPHFQEYWFSFGSQTNTSPTFNQFFEDWFELEAPR